VSRHDHNLSGYLAVALRCGGDVAFRCDRIAPLGSMAISPGTHLESYEVLVPEIHTIGRLIREGVWASRLVWIRDVGHMLVMEKPDEFNRVVKSFLES